MKSLVVLLIFFLGFIPSLMAAEFVRPQRIDVAGNQRIGKDAILNVLSLKPGQELGPQDIRADVRKIIGMGYFKNVTVSFIDSSQTLLFTVDEKTVIRNVKFEGNEEEETEDLQKEVTTKNYAYVDDAEIQRDLERIRTYYDKKGFYLADVQYELVPRANNEADLIFRIQENRKVYVRQISFIGNSRFSDEELKGVMQTREKGFMSFLTDSGSYREEVLAQDRQILRDFYGRSGYIRAKIGAPRVQLAPDRSSLSISMTIEEGDVYKVGSVTLDGEFVKPESELKEKIELKEGETVDTSILQKDIFALNQVYADEGYAYANIIPRDSYDEEKKIVHISYMLQPGAKVYIEKIQFKGNETTRDKVLRREMEIDEGDVYSGTKIRESVANIERLALYEEVRVSTPRGSADDLVNIIIEIQEKQTGTFSIGAGFNTLESFQIIGRIEKRNLFGYGVDLSFQAQIGGRTQSFNLQYRDEHFLDTRFGLTVNAFQIQRRFQDFDRKSTGGSVGLDYPLYTDGLERIRAGVTYSLIDQELSDIRSTVAPLFDDGMTSSFTFSLSRDTRNRVFEPSKGSLLQLSQEIASEIYGSDFNFGKSEFEGRWFFPIFGTKRWPLIGDSVAAFRFNLGYVTPLSDGERLPLFERYFPGGILTLRGFDFGSLGPKEPVASSADPGGFTTSDFRFGGNKQIVFNAEYIFNIIKAVQIKGVLFFDMGNAFDNGESLLTLAGQRQSAGFGIRWFSPIGPLRFEWGFPLDKKEDESSVVFDFTIGSLF